MLTAASYGDEQRSQKEQQATSQTKTHLRCLYPEGVRYHSPGLNAKRSTLGTNRHKIVFNFYPDRVGAPAATHLLAPFQGAGLVGLRDSQPRVGRFASNPGL